jgi:hypothetical protein
MNEQIDWAQTDWRMILHVADGLIRAVTCCTSLSPEAFTRWWVMYPEVVDRHIRQPTLVTLYIYLGSETCRFLPQVEQTLPFRSECKPPTAECQGQSSEDDEWSVSRSISQIA